MSLVLSRKENQTLVLFTEAGEQISLIIRQVDGRRVKLTIDAPSL